MTGGGILGHLRPRPELVAGLDYREPPPPAPTSILRIFSLFPQMGVDGADGTSLPQGEPQP